jgi:hypothetical protein
MFYSFSCTPAARDFSDSAPAPVRLRSGRGAEAHRGKEKLAVGNERWPGILYAKPFTA